MEDERSQMQDSNKSQRNSSCGRTSAGYRVIHVLVPEETFNHVKAQSYLSNLRFPDYLARYLAEARPYAVHKPLPQNEIRKEPSQEALSDPSIDN